MCWKQAGCFTWWTSLCDRLCSSCGLPNSVSKCLWHLGRLDLFRASQTHDALTYYSPNFQTANAFDSPDFCGASQPCHPLDQRLTSHHDWPSFLCYSRFERLPRFPCHLENCMAPCFWVLYSRTLQRYHCPSPKQPALLFQASSPPSCLLHPRCWEDWQ